MGPLCWWLGPFVFCFWPSCPFFPRCSLVQSWAGFTCIVSLLHTPGASPPSWKMSGWSSPALYRLRKVYRSCRRNLQWGCAKTKGESVQQKKRQESQDGKEEGIVLWKDLCPGKEQGLCTLSTPLCCGLHHGLTHPGPNSSLCKFKTLVERRVRVSEKGREGEEEKDLTHGPQNLLEPTSKTFHITMWYISFTNTVKDWNGFISLLPVSAMLFPLSLLCHFFKERQSATEYNTHQ